MDRRRFLDIGLGTLPLAMTFLSSCKSSSAHLEDYSELEAANPIPTSPNGLVTNLRYDKVPVIRSQLKSQPTFTKSAESIRRYALQVLNSTRPGKLSIRSGGHSYIGASVSPNGDVLDLSPFNLIKIDQQAHIIRVGGGCLFHQIAYELAALPKPSFIPSGDCPTVGVGGYISGGGLGRLSPILGMAVDKVVELTAITFRKSLKGFEASIVKASASENSDLFWAMMGGGPQFAILADISFRYTELENYSAFVIGTNWIDEAAFQRIFRDWEDLTANSLASETSANFQISKGATVMSLGVFANSSGDESKLREFAGRHGASIDIRPLTMENMYIMFAGCESLAGCQDKSWTSTKSYSVKKSTLIKARGIIPNANLSQIYQKLTSSNAGWAAFQFNCLGGAARKPNPRVSYPWRDYLYECQISVDTNQQEDWREVYLQWIDDAAALLGERKAAFFNHVNRDILQNKRLYFGASWDRLLLIKKKYDPDNVFVPFRSGDSRI